MPQLSLYLNARSYERLRRAAEREHVSVSKWVAESLTRTLDRRWPEGFERLFGSIADDSFEAPPRQGLGPDSRRETR
jgi:cytidylate kinase